MEYDIFISHNFLDKPWVRILFTFLVARGLKVFFDEESVLPGQNIVSAVEYGMEHSRHILLIISPSSLASRWVALETQLAIHANSDASTEKLLPLIIEKVEWQH